VVRRFVSGGAVRTGDGHVEQAQIDGQLAAMVNLMAQGEVAQRIRARSLEPYAAENFQAPGLVRGRRRGAPQRVFSGLSLAIEFGQQVCDAR
jgi:hypothetical protein